MSSIPFRAALIEAARITRGAFTGSRHKPDNSLRRRKNMLWNTERKRWGTPGYLLLTLMTVVLWQPWPALAGSPQPPDNSDLEIVVLQGEDGVNIIKNKTAVKPVVEVRHKNYLPGVGVVGGVAGAVVYFSLEGGNSAKFANGQKTMSVVTDANGQAVAGDLRPLRPGPVNIKINASYQGQTVTRTITQTNFKTMAAANKAGKIPGSSHGDPGTQMASQGSTEGAGGSGGASASGSALAGSGGHGLMIAGILGGVAAAGGAVAYTEMKNAASSSCPTDAQANAVESAANNAVSACTNGTIAQCQSADQAVLNALSPICACVGGLPSQYASLLNSAAQQAGLSIPSACQ
jgi:hypothetical protein